MWKPAPIVWLPSTAADLIMVMPGLSSKAWAKMVVKIEVKAEAAAVEPPANPNIILATTTSTQDSGLLDVLVPMFEEQTGYIVQTIAVGSGEAIKMGEEGNADVLLVHAPASEVNIHGGRLWQGSHPCHAQRFHHRWSCR